ncbi:MAG: DNA cytosine methyltransferase [Thermodesulfobacteriota bacterium]
MNQRASRHKIARLSAGAAPRILDLFAGCGGLSLGFQAAGFEIAAAVEFDEQAAKSHGTNFHGGEAKHIRARDITLTKPADLAADLSLGKIASAFDVIVGGPPCQAFARVGRSKLREVADHPEAFRHDPRARLYIDYLNYVEACAPLAVVMENVPDMLNHGGHNIAREVCDVLSSRGYVCGYTLLNAAFYGVPQMRERMFLVAIREELVDEIRFPDPTHWIELPTGYEGSRSVALKLLTRSDAHGPDAYYRPAPEAKGDLLPAITSQQALQDLPAIDAQSLLASGKLKRGARRFDQPVKWYGQKRLTDYGRLMREWPGFEGKPEIFDHVIRYLPRDYKLFSKLEAGNQYPEAFRMAETIFKEVLDDLEAREGKRPRKGSKTWELLRAQIVPPYDPGKFPNKWRKMEADQPSRTLLAHLGKDGYSHIHYDSAQARTISVREAARLQSFPDGFVFCGTMNPAFRQIGNAVPPLLAKAVAAAVMEQMRAGLQAELSRQAVAVGGR